MEFDYEKLTDTWKCRTRIFGKKVEVRMIGLENLKKEKVLEDILQRLETESAEIEGFVGDLHLVYNHEWAKPGEGFPRITREEVLNKIMLYEVLYFASEDRILLYFADSDLFGGRRYELALYSDGNMESHLTRKAHKAR